MNLELAIGLVLFALFAVAFLGIKLLRIPDIVIFILAGAALALTDTVKETDIVKVAGEIGLIVLFFLLGLKFTFAELAQKVKKVWKASVLDIVLGVGVTLGICMVMGYKFETAFLIACLVYATSSSITVKLMEHKNRLDNNESGFMLSLLIIEDLVTPILITVLIAINGKGFSGMDFLFIFLKVAVLAAVAVLFNKVIIKKAHGLISRFISEDYFVLFILGLTITYGGFALFLDLSEVIGAFLAGIMLAETEFKDKVEEVAMPVRNLFLPFFFLNFGMSMEFTKDVPAIGLLLIIIIWSILAKVMIGYFGGQWYGLNKRESFESGLSLTPRGEFSVIIAGMAAGAVQVFAGMYILSAALIGMVLFQFAPRLGKFFEVREKTIEK